MTDENFEHVLTTLPGMDSAQRLSLGSASREAEAASPANWPPTRQSLGPARNADRHRATATHALQGFAGAIASRCFHKATRPVSGILVVAEP